MARRIFVRDIETGIDRWLSAPKGKNSLGHRQKAVVPKYITEVLEDGMKFADRDWICWYDRYPSGDHCVAQFKDRVRSRVHVRN